MGGFLHNRNGMVTGSMWVSSVAWMVSLRLDRAGVERMATGATLYEKSRRVGSMHAKQLEMDEVERIPISNFCVYSRFRAHRRFSGQDCRALCRATVINAVAEGGRCYALYESGRMALLLVLRRLDWDSDHFGLGMGRVTMLAVRNARLSPDLAATLSALVAEAGDALQVRHWSAEADIDDYFCLNLLTAVGFCVMDLKRTYCAYQLRLHIKRSGRLRSVEPYQNDDEAVVMRLLEQSHFITRFSRDDNLDQGRVASMYGMWFRQLLEMNGNGANVVVYRVNGVIRACGAIAEFDFAPLGFNRRMMAGGLYVSSRDRGVGGYLPVLYSLTKTAIDKHGMVETSVSANNTAACRVLDRFHSNSVTRYALHLLS